MVEPVRGAISGDLPSPEARNRLRSGAEELDPHTAGDPLSADILHQRLHDVDPSTSQAHDILRRHRIGNLLHFEPLALILNNASDPLRNTPKRVPDDLGGIEAVAVRHGIVQSLGHCDDEVVELVVGNAAVVADGFEEARQGVKLVPTGRHLTLEEYARVVHYRLVVVPEPDSVPRRVPDVAVVFPDRRALDALVSVVPGGVVVDTVVDF